MLDGVCTLACAILCTEEGLPPSLFTALLKALLIHQQRRPYILLCILVPVCSILMALDILPTPKPG